MYTDMLLVGPWSPGKQLPGAAIHSMHFSDVGSGKPYHCLTQRRRGPLRATLLSQHSFEQAGPDLRHHPCWGRAAATLPPRNHHLTTSLTTWVLMHLAKLIITYYDICCIHDLQ